MKYTFCTLFWIPLLYAQNTCNDNVCIANTNIRGSWSVGDNIPYDIRMQTRVACHGFEAYGIEVGEDVYMDMDVFKTRHLILDLGESWCSPCQEHQEGEFGQVHNKYLNDTRIAFIIGLGSLGSPYSCKSWANLAKNIGTSSLIVEDDAQPQWGNLFGNGFYPRLLFISQKRVIYLEENNPYSNSSEFEHAIDKFLETWTEYQLGDVNLDSTINVLDIVVLIQLVLGKQETSSGLQYFTSDYNSDSILNILDIVGIVNLILS